MKKFVGSKKGKSHYLCVFVSANMMLPLHGKIKAIRIISLPRRLSIEIQNCGMSNAHTKLCHESCSILVDMTLLCELNH